MANPQNVELEAAKFLHELMQESKDEPSKLATKLYVILQHMRSSGKENSMRYQVISRAMETVIKEHNLDIESLMSSRLPLAAGSQIGDSALQQLAGSSQWIGPTKESKSGNEIGTPETYVSTRTHSGPVSSAQDMYQSSAAHISGVAAKAHGVSPGALGSYLPADLTNRMQFGNSSFDGHGAAKMSKDRGAEGFPFNEHSAGKSLSGKTLDHGGSSLGTNTSSFRGSLTEPNLTRTAGSRDTEKSPVPQAPNISFPFKEQQLKQLRAQCVVFLAFRNGLMPKKPHLEIALGNIYSKEDGTRRDLVDHKGKEQLVHEPSSVPEVQRSLERPDSSKVHLPSLDSNLPKESDFVKFPDDKSSQPAVPVENKPDGEIFIDKRENRY